MDDVRQQLLQGWRGHKSKRCTTGKGETTTALQQGGGGGRVETAGYVHLVAPLPLTTYVLEPIEACTGVDRVDTKCEQSNDNN